MEVLDFGPMSPIKSQVYYQKKFNLFLIEQYYLIQLKIVGMAYQIQFNAQKTNIEKVWLYIIYVNLHQKLIQGGRHYLLHQIYKKIIKQS